MNYNVKTEDEEDGHYGLVLSDNEASLSIRLILLVRVKRIVAVTTTQK